MAFTLNISTDNAAFEEINPTICPICGVDTALWENLNHNHSDD